MSCSRGLNKFERAMTIKKKTERRITKQSFPEEKLLLPIFFSPGFPRGHSSRGESVGSAVDYRVMTNSP